MEKMELMAYWQVKKGQKLPSGKYLVLQIAARVFNLVPNTASRAFTGVAKETKYPLDQTLEGGLRKLAGLSKLNELAQHPFGGMKNWIAEEWSPAWRFENKIDGALVIILTRNDEVRLAFCISPEALAAREDIHQLIAEIFPHERGESLTEMFAKANQSQKNNLTPNA